jgi:uncharacterized protein (TIGR00255 family)
MLRSMTGYGKTEVSLSDKNVIIEIKSLNSKNLDASVKVPTIYREKELEIRQMISKELERGKIDCTIYYDLNEGVTPAFINEDIFKSYHKSLKKLAEETGIPAGEEMISAILRLPDTIKYEKPSLDENEWELNKNGIKEALNQLNEFRVQEGNSMKNDLDSWLKNIEDNLERVEPYENERIVRIRERIEKNLGEMVSKDAIDNNRLEQEMIYFLEKLDISEEKTRLGNHLRYFRETMDLNDSIGKKLSFISQEMGREINTLGSKANDSDIQHLVVIMKDDLEKIKEQIANIL